MADAESAIRIDADLRPAERAVAKLMAAIEDLTATIKVEADISEAQKAIRRAARNVKAKVQTEADTTGVERAMTRATRPRKVKIETDVDGAAKAEAELDAVARDRKSEVKVDVDGGGFALFRSLATRAVDSVEGIFQQGGGVAGGLFTEGLSKSFDQFSKVGENLFDAFSGGLDTMTESLAGAASGAGDAKGGLGGALGELGQKIGQIITTLFDFGKAAASAAANMTLIYTGVAAIISLTGELVPLTGFLAALPAVAAAAAVGFGTLQIALSGVSDVFKGALTSNAEDFEESLKGLPGNVADAARALRGFKDEWEDLRETVQNNFFAGLDDTISDVGNALGPVLSTGFAAAAEAVNGFVRGLGDLLASKAGVDAVSAAFATFNGIVEALGEPVTKLFGSILGAITDTAPAVTDLFDRLGEGITEFSEWIDEQSSSGALGDWIGEAVDTFSTLWQILVDVVGILGAFKTAADEGEEESGSLLENIASLVAQFREWFESPEGQEFLQNLYYWTNQVVDAIQALLNLLRELTPLFLIIQDAAQRAFGTIIALIDRVTGFINGLKFALSQLDFDKLAEGAGTGGSGPGSFAPDRNGSDFPFPGVGGGIGNRSVERFSTAAFAPAATAPAGSSTVGFYPGTTTTTNTFAPTVTVARATDRELARTVQRMLARQQRRAGYSTGTR
jgi:phage-related protein